jgi:N-acetyl-gamma-glutamyl-phosphate reductase
VGIGILGASGYVGAELVRLLSAHPGAELLALGSRQHAGRGFPDVWPSMPGVGVVLDDDVTDPAAWADQGVEVVFSALPHGAFAARAEAFLAAGLSVVDLSADFRLRSADEYRRRYGIEHPAAGLLPRAIYGLTEWCGPELAEAGLVANPGCYATAALLAALPAVRSGWWSGAPIVVNALSGVSGAGRSPSPTTQFVECANGASPYRVGEEHAHLGEMGQVLGAPDGALIFSPHLVPMTRGIIANVAVPLRRAVDPGEALSLYATRYATSVFVRVLENGALPETRNVRGSNRCDLALRVVAGGRMLLVFAALDNLVKGAAGQAIQNWNRIQGWPEETGLPVAAWACA